MKLVAQNLRAAQKSMEGVPERTFPRSSFSGSAWRAPRASPRSGPRSRCCSSSCFPRRLVRRLEFESATALDAFLCQVGFLCSGGQVGGEGGGGRGGSGEVGWGGGGVVWVELEGVGGGWGTTSLPRCCIAVCSFRIVCCSKSIPNPSGICLWFFLL